MPNQHDGKINLNTASKAELAQIQGIGDECADIIIDYRERHGGIQSVEELADEISGFGEQAVRHLREAATT